MQESLQSFPRLVLKKFFKDVDFLRNFFCPSKGEEETEKVVKGTRLYATSMTQRQLLLHRIHFQSVKPDGTKNAQLVRLVLDL